MPLTCWCEGTSLPVEIVAKILAPPFWEDIERLS